MSVVGGDCHWWVVTVSVVGGDCQWWVVTVSGGW